MNLAGLEFPKAWLVKPIYHPVQYRLDTDRIRIKVVPAGRRSGKTFRAKRKIVKEAMRVPGLYFLGAPTRDQSKKIWWKDIGDLIPEWFMACPPSKSELVYFLKNGSEIHIIGLDKPARIEGQPWLGGIIDEIADCKEETWAEHVRPALDTIGLNTWCWLIGVPEGLNFYYDLFQYAMTAGDPEWAGYTWKSSDILPAKVIEAAKRQLSARQFRQEYEASFENATGRVYDDYSNANHTTEVLDPDKEIIWTHDFNFTPLSSAILQEDKKGHIYAVDEIVLESAVARNTALEFVERYKHLATKTIVNIYGDASGHQGEKHGIASDFQTLQEILLKAGFKVKMKVPRANPSIKDGQNSLRGLICNANGERSLFVNPSKCRFIDKGLKTVQLMKGSTYQEEDSEYQHITTALRYFTSVEHPIMHHFTEVSTSVDGM